MKKLLLLVALSCQLAFAQQVKFFNTFGNGIYDSGEGVVVLPDNGYVVGGITNRGGLVGNNVMIYKTDSLGALQWFKHVGGNGIEGAKSITCNYSNKLALAGFRNNLDSMGYDVFLVQTDLNGDTLWTRSYGGTDWDMAYSIEKLADSTYIVAGETFSYGAGNRDMYVLRVAQNGDTLWTRTFGGAEDDYANFVYVDRHNKIMVVGTTNSYGAGGSDLYAVYMDINGDTLWTKAYGSANDEYGYSADVYIDLSNRQSFALGYTTYSAFEGGQEAHIHRVDTVSGAYINDVGILTVVPSNPEMLDKPRVRMDGRGRFYLCSELRMEPEDNPNIYLHRTKYGFNLGQAENNILYTGSEYAKDIRKALDSGYVVTGEITSFGPGISASFILKVDSVLTAPATVVVGIEDEEEIQFKLYPVPVTHGELFIECESPIELVRIFNLSGQLIQAETGSNYITQQIQCNMVPSGVYVIEIETKKGVGRKKLLVSK